MGSWLKRLAARASVFFISARPDVSRPDLATYTANTVTAINVLQDSWYNVKTGIWDRAWWNSGNAFTTRADFATLNIDAANELNIGGILRKTEALAARRLSQEPMVLK